VVFPAFDPSAFISLSHHAQRALSGGEIVIDHVISLGVRLVEFEAIGRGDEIGVGVLERKPLIENDLLLKDDAWLEDLVRARVCIRLK
jgi:hypothetical protein